MHIKQVTIFNSHYHYSIKIQHQFYMDLQLQHKLFIVGGATSGLGLAIANALLNEGAYIIAIARNKEKLQALQNNWPERVQIISADISTQTTLIIDHCIKIVGNKTVHGVLINAGGPPAKTALETTLQDWDDAYKNILRWKVEFIKHFANSMIEQGFGRIVCIESSAVKQPLENLVLSNSLRLAVVGFIKTLSQEIASTGVTINILAPGSHNTPAIERIYKKKSEQTGLDEKQIKQNAIQQIPVKALGAAEDFASLALWLFSSKSKYITGQVWSVDGGAVKSTL